MVPLLSSCAAIGRVTDTGCLWTRDILIHQQDMLTHVTAQQILAHNLERAKQCAD